MNHGVRLAVGDGPQHESIHAVRAEVHRSGGLRGLGPALGDRAQLGDHRMRRQEVREQVRDLVQVSEIVIEDAPPAPSPCRAPA